MAQPKKNIARWVLQGICVLGILFGLMLAFFAITMPLMIQREDTEKLWFELAISGLMLVLGVWLARDCYRMLRRRSFGAITSISGLLAFAFIGWIGPLLDDLETQVVVENRSVRHWILLTSALAVLLSAALVYSICARLLNRLLKAAYGPEEPSGTRDSAG